MQDIIPINESLALLKNMVDDLQKRHSIRQVDGNGQGTQEDSPPLQVLRPLQEVDRENMALKKQLLELQELMNRNGVSVS